MSISSQVKLEMVNLIYYIISLICITFNLAPRQLGALWINGTHSQIGHCLLTCEVYLIEVLETMAQICQCIICLSRNPIKVSSDFILNYLKKSCRGAPTLRNIKNKLNNRDIFTMDAPQGCQGCQKNQKVQRINKFMCFCANS